MRIIRPSILVIAVGLFVLFGQAAAQRTSAATINTNGKMLYHDGAVMTGYTNVYFIWYGDWSGNNSEYILSYMVATMGNSPYMRINTTYPDVYGLAPSGGFVYSGAAYDNYSHGRSLTYADIQDILSDMFWSSALFLDNRGIYIFVAASDVQTFDFGGSEPCEFHRKYQFVGADVRYAVIPNSDRRPSLCAPQFVGSSGALLPTPNNDLGGDAMASWLAHAVNGLVTNPAWGGWYDRNWLENSDKCVGKFGTTYLTANGARANVNFGGYDYLIQQNWVNDKKGRCALSYP